MIVAPQPLAVEVRAGVLADGGNAFDAALTAAVVQTKHPIEWLARSHGGMALVHAIAIDEQTGQLTGAADTGADGMALRGDQET